MAEMMQVLNCECDDISRNYNNEHNTKTGNQTLRMTI